MLHPQTSGPQMCPSSSQLLNNEGGNKYIFQVKILRFHNLLASSVTGWQEVLKDNAGVQRRGKPSHLEKIQSTEVKMSLKQAGEKHNFLTAKLRFHPPCMVLNYYQSISEVSLMCMVPYVVASFWLGNT